MSMTAFEMKLAADLLRMASDTFSNHGCNDYKLEDTPEARDLLHTAEDGEGVHLQGGKLWTQDWLLMSYLANRLLKEAERA